MKTSFISTQSISEATRASLARLQSRLAEAQEEVTTGRLADVGASLGYRTGQTVSLRQELGRLTTLQETNALASSRLNASQAALSAVVDSAQSFLSTLIGARTAESFSRESIQTAATAGLTTLADTVNTTFGGAYIFSGENTDVKPLVNYFQVPTAPNRQAVTDAFLSTFGISQTSPAVDGISATDVQTFLDTTFADLFADPSYTTVFSAASDQNIRSRISTTELIDTSANANEQAFRDLAAAYTIIADLGAENFNDAAYSAAVDTALDKVGQALAGLANIQSRLGTAQERISNADNRAAIQSDILTTRINDLEAIDQYEASTEVSTILTQIETAYSLTARIQRLSLLNFI